MKLLHILSTVAIAATMTACSLDYEPVAQYSDVTVPPVEDEEYEARFKTRADVESYMQSIKNLYHESMEHWYLDHLLIAEVHSDNAYYGTTDMQGIPHEDNSIDGSNTIMARDWDRHLSNVAYCNVLICEIDNVADHSLTEQEITTFKAQARLCRAMIWFDMVRLWGHIPLVTTIPGNITADNIEESYQAYFPSQTTSEEVYNAIVEDLEYALEYAPKNSGDKSALTQEVAIALLAKVYAESTLRDYSKTIQYSEMLEQRGYNLVSNFHDLFGMNAAGTDAAARNTIETIYEAQFQPGAGSWVTWMFGRDELDWNSNFSWAKWVTPSRDMIALFTSQGDEIRYKESVVWRDCTWSINYPSDNYAFMYKCRSNANSVIKMRFADILLLRAEAYILGENPNLEAAAKIIDRVRSRAGLAPLTASVRTNRDQLLKAYMDERRMELCFEGERWFDLVRLGKVEEVMNTVQSRDPGRMALRNPYTEISYLMPIPQAALDQNDNLVQNPGY